MHDKTSPDSLLIADTPPHILRAAEQSRAWPFEEARKLVKRLENRGGDALVFETGYGPSGLPHIGTFGEVARTTMVRHAFRVLTKDTVPTRLICFSDDMDALRKVPGNVPNQEMMGAHIGLPLSSVPDPYSPDPHSPGPHSPEYESFAHHNNAHLRRFLDRFGFDYEFASATQYYRAGRFDAALLKMLAVYDEVMDIIVPTLGPERRETYSPFLPICPRTGKVLQVPMVERDPEAGTVTYLDPDTAKPVTTPVTGGSVKCQWKADWALRWTALGVDYEMAGKDLIDSVRLSGRICRALGGSPPEGFNYELFLDENGEKISKSRGNGLTIDEWLAYAAPESLSLFMFAKPKTAKRLYFDIIPRAVDDYFAHVAAYRDQEPERQVANPVWHIHGGELPARDMPLSFAMLLNLVSASNAEDRDVLWSFITRSRPGVTPQSHPELDALVDYAIRYFHDFVKPNKQFRAPTDQERRALQVLDSKLEVLPSDADAETIQNQVYEIGKTHDFDNLRDWFKALYQILLGQDQGPRFGSFVAIYGIRETRDLIGAALAGRLVTEKPI